MANGEEATTLKVNKIIDIRQEKIWAYDYLFIGWYDNQLDIIMLQQ